MVVEVGMIDEEKLFKEFEEELAKQIQEEIDREIIEALRKVSLGWTSVPFHSHLIPHEEEINVWLKENIKGDHSYLRHHIYFEDKNDAMLFQLRWS